MDDLRPKWGFGPVWDRIWGRACNSKVKVYVVDPVIIRFVRPDGEIINEIRAFSGEEITITVHSAEEVI